jgi:hypothetical protein
MKSIFVVGTGRSGTHYTIRLLAGFANSSDPLNGKENPDILYPIARAAIHHTHLSRSTVKSYEKSLAECRGVFLDQHHPNLFFAEFWSKTLADPVFLFPQRATEQIVSSMLRHPGVLSWYDYAKSWKQRIFNRIPYPNQFFGVENYEEIVDLPLHLLCARRVIAHRKAFADRAKRLPGRMRAIDYQALVTSPEAELRRVFTAAELETLGTFSLCETPQKEPLEKFRENLSTKQIDNILDLEARALGTPASTHA